MKYPKLIAICILLVPLMVSTFVSALLLGCIRFINGRPIDDEEEAPNTKCAHQHKPRDGFWFY